MVNVIEHIVEPLRIIISVLWACIAVLRIQELQCTVLIDVIA